MVFIVPYPGINNIAMVNFITVVLMGMKNEDIIQSEGKYMQYSAILRFFWSIAKICRSIVRAIPAIYKLPPMEHDQCRIYIYAHYARA